MSEISDFRSDTVTRPTGRRRRAMAGAVVGDDVLGDDPTCQDLEALAAGIMGKEAALFVPSGTMGNSIAVKAWTHELEEVILEARAHIYNMESTHLTFISRVTLRPIASLRGVMDPAGVDVNISTAPGVPVKDYASSADSVMFCLSKGLSAPVGSMLAGPRDFIEYGRRVRKALGGGMRQAGVLAAPGDIALTGMPG